MSDNISVLKRVESSVNEAAIAQARQILELCESGEALSISAVVHLRGNNYKLIGPSGHDRHKMAGELLELAIARLEVTPPEA